MRWGLGCRKPPAGCSPAQHSCILRCQQRRPCSSSNALLPQAGLRLTLGVLVLVGELLLLFRALMMALKQARMAQAATQHTMLNDTARPQQIARTVHAARNQQELMQNTKAQNMALMRVINHMLLFPSAAIAGAASLLWNSRYRLN